MSREPRGVTGHKLVASTDPYLKQQQVGATSSAVAAAASVAAGTIQTITSTRQFEAIVGKRVKPLPPDANTTDLKEMPQNTNLYQLETPILFNCAKCRRNNVRSDLLAVSLTDHQFLCSKCFTRMIRPRNFTPTRLVPFPSLLSWLNYQKPSLLDALTTTGATSAAYRPAEAVVPTGDRLATGLAVNGFSNTDVRALPSSAMVHEIGANDVYGQQALSEMQQLHPCFRLWGADKCAHGALCSFTKAPYKQAIEYLMGIATREQCVAEGLIVDDVFGLPNKNDPIPSDANVGPSPPTSSSPLTPATSVCDIHNPTTTLGQWFLRRSKTLNQPEWQLFHNGPIEALIGKYNTFSSSLLPSANNGDGDDVAVEDVVGGTPLPPTTSSEAATTGADAHMAALMEEDDDDDLGALLDNL